MPSALLLLLSCTDTGDIAPTDSAGSDSTGSDSAGSDSTASDSDDSSDSAPPDSGEGHSCIDQRPEDDASEETGDCNHNGIDDTEDLDSGFSVDCDGDGVPDECGLFTDGCVVTGDHGWYTYSSGTLPVILSAPHGSAEMPEELQDREDATITADTNTAELTEAVSDALYAATGQRPHVILMNISRVKVEANAWSVEDATAGQPEAEAVYLGYHGFIDAAARAVEAVYGRGLYIDIHGLSSIYDVSELGYLMSGGDFAVDNERLDHPGYAYMSSLRSIAAFHTARGSSAPFSELIRGSESFGGLLEAGNIPAVPSPTMPWPVDDDGEVRGYFDGGYSTHAHGSRLGGSISGLQIETTWDIRSSSAGRAAMAETTAEAIAVFLDAWMALTLTGSSVAGFAAERAILWEAGEPLEVGLSRAGDTTAALTVGLETSGSASPGTDLSVPTSATFDAGSATTTITLTPMDDSDAEGPEDLTITLTRDTTHNIGPIEQLTLHLADDEHPAVWLEAGSEATEGSPMSLSVRRDDCATAATIDLALSGEAAESTSAEPIDFAPGEDTVTITLTMPADGAITGTTHLTAALLDDGVHALISQSTVTLAIQDADLDETLTAWLEGTPHDGALLDRASGGHDGVLMPETGGPTVSGGVMSFDGDDDALMVGEFEPTGEDAVSLTFWFRADSGGSDRYGYLFSHGNYFSSEALNIYLTSGGTLRTVLTGSNEEYDYDLLDVSGDFHDDSWHHYAVVLESGGSTRTTAVYVDGVEQTRAYCGEGGIFTAGLQTFIGSRNDTYHTTHFQGDLRDVRVYLQELNASEVADLAVE